MSTAIVPALVVGAGGSLMLAGIAANERAREARMRASRERLGLWFPKGLDGRAVTAALDGLAGLRADGELIWEICAREGAITHGLWVPARDRAAAAFALTGAVGSLRITSSEPPMRDFCTRTLRLFVPRSCVLRADDPMAPSRALLAGLAALRSGEQVCVRWALTPQRPPARTLGTDASERDREREKAWRAKDGLPGFAVSGLVLIRASQARARDLASQVEAGLRARRGPVDEVRVTVERGQRRLDALPRVSRSSGWVSTHEVRALLGIPLGSDVPPGVVTGSRQLLVSGEVPRKGRRLFVGRDATGDRPVALDPVAARHHMAVCGPSGAGKSVLLARAILDDIAGGFGGAVIDPKSDLLETILDRVPPEHAERIVVLDPGDARVLPGLSLLSGGDPDSRADVLTGTLKSIFAGAWGVRSDFYGRLAIRTLSEVPGATLADMGRLFYEEPFRRAALARLRDPFLVSSWQSYESLSPAAQAEHVHAPMTRVMTLLSRPRVRTVLAAPEPKLDIPRLFAERKWLLVSLAPGAISEAGATLVGASLMYAIWSAIEGRVKLAPEKRHPLFLYVDELATVTNGLPFGFELMAERARGLGAGLTVALQTIGRISEPTRSALLGNVSTFITFRAGAAEAATVARQLPGLSQHDVAALGRFEVAARVSAGGGSAVTVATGHTEPLPPVTGLAESIRDHSAERYGTPPPVDTPQPESQPRAKPTVGRTRRAS